MLKGKNIVLGITGGIAAYKACEIVRELRKAGVSVTAIMTKNACEFITPLTLQTLTKNGVISGQFDLPSEFDVCHINLAKETDLLLVVPATANIIAKFASGIADDFLSTFYLAFRGKILIAPAMNSNMYLHHTTKENIKKLSSLGVEFIEPQTGELACGDEGIGKLAEVSLIIEKVKKTLLQKSDLKGEKILITAGGTQEAIDPVRYITNRSSGKMGYALAKVALARGADVTLVSAPTGIPFPPGAKIINVLSASQMREAVLKNLPESTMIIKAAAVSDFKPQKESYAKIKKDEKESVTLKLEKTPDILLEVGKKKGKRILVGFAAETENLIKNAQKKLKEKNCDLIVANDVTQNGAGFNSDTNIVKLIDRNGKIKDLPKLSKEEVAEKIFDRILNLKKL